MILKGLKINMVEKITRNPLFYTKKCNFKSGHLLAIKGAEGKKNNPVLNILISLIKMFEIL